MRRLALSLLVVALASPAWAATRTWDGGGADALATTAANWSSDIAPVAGDDVVFDATSTKACTWDLSSGVTLGSFSINAGAQAITLNTGITLSGAYYQASGTVTFNAASIIIAAASADIQGGTVTHASEPNGSGTTAARQVYFSTSGSVTVGAGGTISTAAKGFAAGSGPAAGVCGAGTPACGGGGNGGDGGNGTAGGPGAGGLSGIGSIASPVTAGSGGSAVAFQGWATGGAGGGVVSITATGTMTVAGTITANGSAGTQGGGNGNASGGAGGSIYLSAATLTGGGAITANGGAGAFTGGSSAGGGGGGKIALVYSSSTRSGTLTAYGGAGANGGGAGAAGTVVDGGSLTVNNNSQTAGTSSVTRVPATSVSSVALSNTGKITLTGALVVSGAVTIGSGTVLTQGQALTVGGSFSNAGTFTSSALVTLNTSAACVIVGANTFSALTIAPASGGKTVTFPASTTQTITNGLTLTGSRGNVVTLRSSSSGTRFTLTPNGSKSATWLDVKDSLASSTITADNTIDSGNNSGWTITAPASATATPRASRLPNPPLQGIVP